MKNAFFNGSSTYTPSDCTYYIFLAMRSLSTPWLEYEDEWIAFANKVSKTMNLLIWKFAQISKQNANESQFYKRNSVQLIQMENVNLMQDWSLFHRLRFFLIKDHFWFDSYFHNIQMAFVSSCIWCALLRYTIADVAADFKRTSLCFCTQCKSAQKTTIENVHCSGNVKLSCYIRITVHDLTFK